MAHVVMRFTTMRAHHLLFFSPVLGLLNSCTDGALSITGSSQTSSSSADPSSTTTQICNGGRLQCRSQMLKPGFRPLASPSANGYAPSDLATAYGFDPTTNPNATIA